MVSLRRFDKLIDTAKEMTSETRTGFILILTFFFSLFLSSFFIIGVAVKGDFAVSGGSDAYYNMRIVQYILSTHHQLLFDPGLNFPLGLQNPRPPFFHWLIVLLGYAFSPFLGGVYNSTMIMFLESTAIGGAFIVFPTYFLGKELYGRKIGIIAAVLVAMSPLTLMKSISTIGLFDIFTALFGVMFIYYFLRAVNTFNFESSGGGLIKDIASSVRSNPLSIVYSLLAGVSLAASMLTWVGTISLILILTGSAVVQIFVYAIKKKSIMSIFIANLFFGSGFLIAYPWYAVAHFVPVRFEYPLIVWLVLLVSSLYYLVLRKRPWLLSIGIFIIAAVIGLLVIERLNNQIIYSIISGQHYFIKNKVYDTIAEAQSLPLGEDMIEYGPFMFFASFVGLAYLAYKWVRTADFNSTIALIYFGGIIVISMIASKFLYFGAVAASILSGYIIVKSFELISFKETVEKAKDRPIKTALKRELKFSHYVVVLIVVFLLVVPTTFYAVDSAIPYNNKSTYDGQIYNATPTFLRPSNYTAPYYLGALGVSLSLPSSPWDRALSWFENQDTQLAPNQRPAFMSWWDYGFQTIEQGGHPVMADNFQDGIYPAAQLLMAQNESQMISVMIARMLQSYEANGSFGSSAVVPLLKQYLGSQGADQIISYEANPESFLQDIYNNPGFYGQYESVQSRDIIYILVEHYISNKYSLSTLIDLYSAIETQLNSYMSYISVDYGLFPFSGTSTGIFYAPAFLGDFPYVNASGEIIPTTFYNINVTDINGNVYPLQDFPSGDTAVNYSISYEPAFYNTTIYRAFIGYPPSVVGATGGIPGITSNLQYYYPMQGWGLSNFEVVYKTVFWNPYTDYQNHSNAWVPVSLEQGYKYLSEHKGTVDLNPPASQILTNDVVFLEYFPGAVVHGKVTNTAGQPVAGIRVTLTDQYGIPHQTVVTNSTGDYSLFAVEGNDTVTYSNGPYNPLMMVGNNTLSKFNVTITGSMANRMSYNSNGIATWNITHNLVLKAGQVNGVLFLDVGQTSTYSAKTDVPLNGTILYTNQTYNTTYEVNTATNGSYHISGMKPYTYEVSAETFGIWYRNVTKVTIASGAASGDVPIESGALNISEGNAAFLSGKTFVNMTRGNFSKSYLVTGNNALLNLPVGTYSISASNGIFKNNFTERVLYNKTVNITLSFSKYYTINFLTEINGNPVSAPIRLMKTNSSDQVIMTNSYGRNNFSTIPSVYSIYSNVIYNGKYYSSTAIINVSGSETVIVNLEPSTLVTGEYVVGNKNQSLASVSITGTNTYVPISTNATGQFSIYLPTGKYSFVAHSVQNSTTYVASSYVGISGSSRNLLLIGSVGRVLHGNVSFNGIPIPGLVATTLNGRPYMDTFVYSSSQYSVYLLSGVTPYSYTYISPGYSVQAKLSSNMDLKQLPVTISIHASYSGSYPLILQLKGTENYSISGAKWFNVSVQPGNYVTTFSSGNFGTLSSLGSITVSPAGNDQIFTASLSFAATLNVNSPGRVYVFSNGNLVSSSSVSKLSPRNYVVYSYLGNLSAISSVDLTQNMSIDMTFEPSYVQQLVTNYEGNVTIGTSEGPLSWSGSILLPSGTYSFTFTKPYNISAEYYSSATRYISSFNIIYLNSTLKQLVSSVTIKAYYNGESVSSGTYYIQGQKTTTGYLSAGAINLPYGSYSIYLSSGDKAYLGSFVLNSTAAYENLTLEKAYTLSYGTYLNNTTYYGNVYIKGEFHNYIVPSTGAINLPDGQYTFTASKSAVFYGVSSNYFLNQSVKVSGISSGTLVLRLNQTLNVSLIPEAGTPYLLPNDSYIFPLLIRSYSNVPLTFTIANESGFGISAPSISLNPRSSGVTNVTVTVPKSTPSGPEMLDARVYYGGTYQDFSISVSIGKVMKISATVDNLSGIISGSEVKLPLNITNVGNTLLNITATIVNLQELRNSGIIASINGNTSMNTLLGATNVNNSYIILKSAHSGLISGAVVYVALNYSGNTKIIEVEPVLPTVNVDSATGNGTGISAFSHTIQNYYIYGFSVFIVLAMIVVMLIFRRRLRT